MKEITITTQAALLLVLLVNDMSGSTHVFDPEKHLLCKAVKS